MLCNTAQYTKVYEIGPSSRMVREAALGRRGWGALLGSRAQATSHALVARFDRPLLPRVLHTSRLGIKRPACHSASYFKGAGPAHTQDIHPHRVRKCPSLTATSLRTAGTLVPARRLPPASLWEVARAQTQAEAPSASRGRARKRPLCSYRARRRRRRRRLPRGKQFPQGGRPCARRRPRPRRVPL